MDFSYRSEVLFLILLVFYMYIFKSVIYCAEHVNMNIPAKAVLHVKLYLYMNHVSALIKSIFELNWIELKLNFDARAAAENKMLLHVVTYCIHVEVKVKERGMERQRERKREGEVV